MGLSFPDWQGAEADIMIVSMFQAGCVPCGTGAGTSKSCSLIPGCEIAFTAPSERTWLAVMLDGWAYRATGGIVIRALVGPARSPYSSLVGHISGLKSVDFYCILLIFWAQPPVGLRFLWWPPPVGLRFLWESSPGGPKIYLPLVAGRPPNLMGI